ncbi:DUF6758 family protein [Nocardioides sp.]|uniref:DUF6758 family protein n=1 Tax=Nocardioides sp. TaxID=35761 RepID=UPI002CE27825|nr:DUF6758 family protein [Nocardioides sp.]HXH80478.1 DUF6758 family protein [Nocardioides sp.]
MLLAGCPQCAEPVRERESGWECPAHRAVTPLWRPREAVYEAFVDHLARADDCPTLLPWPMAPAWQVSDFGVVAAPDRSAMATVTCCSGMSELDGAVDVLIVSEEPGTGLGARVARLGRSHPTGVGEGPPVARVRVGRAAVPLWTISTGEDPDLDRSVLVGEAEGRWLWFVLYPASAALLLGDDWILRDAADAGAGLVELTFGGTPPHW